MIVRHFKTFQITRIHWIVQRVLACILQDTGHLRATIPCSMPFRFLITGLDAPSPSVPVWFIEYGYGLCHHLRQWYPHNMRFNAGIPRFRSQCGHARTLRNTRIP